MRRFPVAVTLVLAGALAACDATDAKSAQSREPLTVGYSALRISLPVFVARQRNMFARHGLEVELRRYETAQPLVEEVLDGRVDAGATPRCPSSSRRRARTARGRALPRRWWRTSTTPSAICCGGATRA